MATRGKHPSASADDLAEISSGKASARDRAEAAASGLMRRKRSKGRAKRRKR